MTTGSADSMGSGAYATSRHFVINLCSSTSPMALAHPSSPELKRYTFFVSRQRQDGRDRFRLHMGYFDSQEQAELLLEVVRDVYPAAWAGPAPIQGSARRSRTAPAQPPAAPAAEVAPAAPVVEKPAPASVAGSQDSAPPSLEQTMSEMRDVLSKLDDAAPTVQAPQPEPPVVQPAKSDVRPAPAAVQPTHVVDPPRLQPVTQPKVAASKLVTPRVELTPEQALTLLETAAPAASAEDDSKVRMLTPEDTQTLRDIKLDKANNAPPSFAVQLAWSVTPIDSGSMPHLAIFDAYTLYNVEGNRQGRKWYGLRLGFFTDPNSATQVANYVRSDYRSVAVVPVSTREIDHARGGSPVSPGDSAINPPLRPVEQFSTNREAMTGFELVADDRPARPKRDLEAPTAKAASSATTKASSASTAGSQGKSFNGAGKPAGRRAVNRRKPERKIKVAPGAADVLESTLEILGASTLTIDESTELVIDEAGRGSKPASKKPQNSKFSKLLSRLGGG